MNVVMKKGKKKRREKSNYLVWSQKGTLNNFFNVSSRRLKKELESLVIIVSNNFDLIFCKDLINKFILY